MGVDGPQDIVLEPSGWMAPVTKTPDADPGQRGVGRVHQTEGRGATVRVRRWNRPGQARVPRNRLPGDSEPRAAQATCKPGGLA